MWCIIKIVYHYDSCLATEGSVCQGGIVLDDQAYECNLLCNCRLKVTSYKKKNVLLT